MNRETTTRAYDDESRFVLQIEAGGTGATNVIDAAINLGVISSDNLGQPSGVASLAANVKVPLSQLPYLPGNELPSIDGPSSVSAYEIVEYLITNFDSQTTYNISANHGNVLLHDGRFLYSADGYVGIDVITINDKVFGISVSAAAQPKPVIVSPTQNGSILITDLFVLNAQDITNDIDIITSVDWEITLLNDQPIIHHSVGSDGVNFVIPNLIRNESYSVRARITSQLLGNSEWSDPITFATAAVAIPETEVAQLHPFPSTAHTKKYGISTLAISTDGNVVVTADTFFYFTLPEPAKHSGRVFIYSYENGNWVQNALDSNIIDDGVFLQGEYFFGSSIALSLDKQKILVLSSHDLNTPITNFGTDPIGDVRIYETITPNDYSAMNLIATYPAITYGNNNTYQGLSYTISTTPNFERIAFCINAADRYNRVVLTVVCILNFDGVNITSDVNISKLSDTSLKYSNSSFGENVSLSENGLTLVVGSKSQQINNTDSCGAIYVYERINDVWTETNVLEPDDAIAERYFGWPCTISPDGTKIATFSNTDSDNTGNVYLFEKVGNTWTKTTKYVMPEMRDDQLGGEATSMCFNADGTLLLMGSPWQSTPAFAGPDGSWASAGMCYLLDVSGSEITLVQTYSSPDVLNNDQGEYGEMVAFSRDGSTIVIASPYSGHAIDSTKAGAIFVYK